MTGRSEPTQDELLKNLVDRLSATPSLSLSKRYNREGLNKILDYLGMNSHEAAAAVLGGVKLAEKTAHPSGTGHNGGSHHGSSYSTSPASVGLAIQSVLSFVCYISFDEGLEGRTLDVGIISMMELRDIEYLQRYGHCHDWYTTPCIPDSHRYRIGRSLGWRRGLPGSGRKLCELRKVKRINWTSHVKLFPGKPCFPREHVQ